MAGKEYKMALKIAGKIENSFYSSTKLTKKELAAIAREARMASAGTGERLATSLKESEPAFREIEKTGSAAFHAITEAAALAATAAGGVAAASVAVGSSFEAQMSSVAAISGASVADMQQLNSLAGELGRSTQFTATEAGQAMEYMAMAGWKTEDMLSGMSGVLNLAAASGEDLAMTADIVTDAMTAFKMEAYEVGHFSDVLAAASSNSNTNVSMMGETFKYVAPLAGSLGYEIEDVSLAIGLMANSSLKGSMSGTALRKIITNLSSGVQLSGRELGKYQLTAQEADGSMRDFGEVIDDLRYAFSRMTEAEQKANAEAIAGATGMNGVLAIAGASEKDYNKLTEAINDCSGAAERMADIRLDNLSGDITIMQSALEGVGVQIYDGLLREPLREGTQWLTELTGSLAESGFIEEISAKVPTAVRQVKELAGTVQEFAQPFFAVAGWLTDHPGIITGAVASLGTAIGTYKIATGVMSVASAFSSLTPAGLGILGIAGVAGVITGIGTAVKKSAEEAKRADLAAHFGDISLSLSELDAVAEGIVHNDSLRKVWESIAAFEELDGMQDAINDSANAIQKMNWKLSIGIELTTDELDTYQQKIGSYVEQCREYLVNDQYAAGLSAEALFGDSMEGKDFVERMQRFYAGKEEELAGLGRQLNNAMTEAFNDGILDLKEAEVIAEIQADMAEIQAQLSGNNFESGLEVLATKYGGNLDAESFQNLAAELAGMQEEAVQEYDELYNRMLTQARNMNTLEDGTLDREGYQADAEAARKAYLDRQAEMQAKTQGFLMDTINSTYGKELSEALPELDKYFGKMFDSSYAYSWQDKPGIMWNTVIQDLKSNDILDKNTKDALGEIYELMQPLAQIGENLAAQYQKFGYDTPQSVVSGMDDMAGLGALAGNREAILTAAGSYVAESDETMEMLQNTVFPKETEVMVNGVRGISEEVAAAYEENQYLIDDAIQNSHYKTTELMKELFGQETDIMMPLNVKAEVNVVPAGAPYASAAVTTQGKTGGSKPDIDAYATGGIIQHKTLAWFAEDGPEAAIPLDGSRNAVDLWLKTGELLGIGYQNNPDTFSGIERKTSSMSVSSESAVNAGGFSPVLNFYGEAPKKEDLDSAFDDAMDKFDAMMQRWTRERQRTSLR